jgi:beta-lactamase superfamily II metal-dependent hydrolase
MHKFVALKASKGKTLLYKDKTTKHKVREVLWGDWLTIADGSDGSDGWFEVIWSPKNPAKRQTLYIPKDDVTDTRPLEIVFVDVGQGDGSVLITPENGGDERILVIDAGKGGEMHAFLKGRFDGYGDGLVFHAAVITHPDNDHYLGFRPIFGNSAFGFKHVYHNGLVERSELDGFDTLGGQTKDPVSGVYYVEALAQDHAEMTTIFAADPGTGNFAGVIKAGMANPKVGEFSMLSTQHGTMVEGRSYVPEFAPGAARPYSIEVLGPVPEQGQNGPRLRCLDKQFNSKSKGNPGKTKNAHSVLLKLRYGKFSILFGGDLNVAAEQYLLAHYAGLEAFPDVGTDAHKAMLAEGKKRFGADVMKVCHHGASDVTDEFLSAVNPAAFVISSGDREGHVHPRPDLLGRLGRFGRGEAPVLLSTELQRSVSPAREREQVRALQNKLTALTAAPTEAQLKTMKEDVAKLGRSNVDVYGAIYVKTNGDRLITAFKREQGSDTDKWFWYEYKLADDGSLTLID